MAIINLHKFRIKIPTRFNIGVMLFMACLMSYVMKVNFSLNIIAMVQPQDDNNNSTNIPPDYGPRYNWTQKDQGFLLGSYFYGYLVTSLPGGMLAEKFGGRAVAGYTLIFSSILTILTPFAANLNMWAVWGIRFLTGLLGGVVYPACHNLISKWAPPDEKGKFVAALMGGTFGTVITWPICGVIVENIGWNWAFFLTGGFCFIVTIIWFILVADTPGQHRFINRDEQKYIENSLGNTIGNVKKLPPFLSLLTSLPFIALALLHYGNMWGLTFLITAAPKFLSEVLGFKLSSAGFLSSLPHLARLIMAFIFGSIVDVIRRREMLSVTKIRKSFCLASHILPGIFLFVLAYFGREPMVCVAIITLSLGFNGSAAVTNLQNSQDLAPNYAGSLYGIINFFGNTPGIFSPMIVAFFTEEQNTLEEWKNVFLVGGAVYIIPAIIFFIFGSGEIQKWNYLDENISNSNNDNSNNNNNNKNNNEINDKEKDLKQEENTHL